MKRGSAGQIAKFGVFELDLAQRRLTKAGYRVRLQEQPFQILALLLEHPGEIVTRERIKERLWAGDTFVAFDDGLNTAIKKLRAALSDTADNPRFIETVPRIGYRFIAPISMEPPVCEEPSLPSDEATILEHPSEAPKMSAAASAPPTAGITRPSIWAWIAVGATCLVLACALGWARWRAASDRQSPSINAIAVLPLQNTSADPAQEYLADGMTDEIITNLAKLAGPKVISRTSVMPYKTARRSIPEIARELHVGAIVEGSVESSGDRMRVRVQLIDAATDQHLWAESYDRQMSDVLQLESDVAKDVAREIQLHLTPQQQKNLAQTRPSNPQAFQNYLQGRQYFAMRTKEGLLKAIDYYNRAIAEDPGDARSYAGLAHCYIVLPLLYNTSQADDYAKARAAADKALALDDSLAEAHLARAEVLFSDDWNFAAAEQEFKRTLALNPNYATGHQWYGEFLSEMARPEEGIREEETAVSLDPLSGVVHHQLGQSYQQAHQYDRAIAEYKRALELNPSFAPSWEAMSWAFRRKGDYAQAIEALRPGLPAWEPLYPGLTGGFEKMRHGLASGGKTGFLRGAMEFHRHYPRPSLYLARDSADLGDKETALAALERSYQQREPELLYLFTDPEFDSLRSDARFQELVRRIGKP